MWKVIFARVDDRLIHGQVITQWLRGFSVNSIFIIDDVLASDEFMRNVYAMAAPSGVKVKILNVETASKEWSKNTGTNENVFLLFKDVPTVERSVKSGIPIKVLNIGGLARTSDRKPIIESVGINPKEAEILWNLYKEYNVEIFFQMLPGSGRVDIASIKRHFPQLV